MAFRYKTCGKFLICIDQPLTAVIGLLVFGYRKNGLESLGISWKTMVRFVSVLLKSKLSPPQIGECLILPVFGHVGLQVHRGHKVFDLVRFEVTKVFTKGTESSDANAEISASKTASLVTVAPRFLVADADSAWFREEYICGPIATNFVTQSSSDFLRYYPDVEKCLLELAGSEPVVEVPIRDHINALGDRDFSARWLAAGVDPDDVGLISEYIGSLEKWFREKAKPQSLQLVPTHGDFSLVNTLVTERGIRVIDWEGKKPGSVYADLLNFALVERYYGRASTDFVSETQSLLDHYQKALIKRHPLLENSASMDREFSRRIYFLERIRLLLERDVTQNLAKVVKRSIAIFKKFDTDLGGVPL